MQDDELTSTICPWCDGLGYVVDTFPRKICQLCRGTRLVPVNIKAAWLAVRRWLDRPN